MTETYDCIVLGAGPAGSTVATLVAAAGSRTLLLEREKMPRFHIGESLMPETYSTLVRLGLLERMKHSHFVKKYSVQFVSHTGRESEPFYFRDRDPRECAQTWQVRRSEFDDMLFRNAAEKGAICRDGVRVVEVLFDGDRATGVRVAGSGGSEETITARVVVDATGFKSLLGSKLGLRRPNPRLRKSSIWAYYRGAQRDQGIDEGATIVLHTRDKRAWFWYIPLHDDITSVGVVGDSDYLFDGRGAPADIFEEELVKCEAVAQRLLNAELADSFRVVRDFSYQSEQAAGPGWVLVGDAYTFLDPIYSSGVFLALKSGEMAADAILEGLARNDLSATQLGKWSDRFDRGVALVRKLVYAFYTERFSFGQFIKQFPQHRGNLTDLLVGKVFEPGAEAIFADMDSWLEQAEADEARRLEA